MSTNGVRNHSGNPLCGDVWRLKDGRYLVVDYKDSLWTGFTFSNGNAVIGRGSHGHTAGFQRFLEINQSKLISSFEDFPYPLGVDDQGWTDAKYDPDTEDRNGSRSVAFLQIVLERRTLLVD